MEKNQSFLKHQILKQKYKLLDLKLSVLCCFHAGYAKVLQLVIVANAQTTHLDISVYQLSIVNIDQSIRYTIDVPLKLTLMFPSQTVFFQTWYGLIQGCYQDKARHLVIPDNISAHVEFTGSKLNKNYSL